MLGEYRKLNSESGIPDFPSVVNYNCEISEKEFDNIFDSKNGYLIQSLFAPKGKVDAHEGRFVNLRVKNLIVEKNTFNANTKDTETEHKELSNRFSWDFEKLPTVSMDTLDDFAHDSRMIVSFADSSNPISVGQTTFFNPISLREELDAIESCLTGVAKNISIKESDGSDNVTDILKETDDIPQDEMSYGSYMIDENQVDEILKRIKKIERRLTNIEKRLDGVE